MRTITRCPQCGAELEVKVKFDLASIRAGCSLADEEIEMIEITGGRELEGQILPAPSFPFIRAVFRFKGRFRERRLRKIPEEGGC